DRDAITGPFLQAFAHGGHFVGSIVLKQRAVEAVVLRYFGVRPERPSSDDDAQPDFLHSTVDPRSGFYVGWCVMVVQQGGSAAGHGLKGSYSHCRQRCRCLNVGGQGQHVLSQPLPQGHAISQASTGQLEKMIMAIDEAWYDGTAAAVDSPRRVPISQFV